MYLTDITIGQSLLYSIVAIAGVFLILLIIVLCVNILSLIKYRDTNAPKAEAKAQTASPASSVDPALVEADDDMMAAVLVASIDFYNETKQNARCVSVKQIN